MSVSNRTSPFCFSGPWHFTQCSARKGRRVAAKSGDGAGAAGAKWEKPSPLTTNPNAVAADVRRRLRMETGWCMFRVG